MSDYQTLFDKGYFFGKIDELSINRDEFLTKTNDIVFIAENNKNSYFKYQHVVSDLPHIITIEEVETRKEFMKKNPNLNSICSTYIMVNDDRTKHFFEYFRNIVINFIPKVFNDITTDNISINDSIQLFEDGDKIQPHTDNHIGECAMVIYFSDYSTYNGSGKLNILKKQHDNIILDSLDPIFGNYSLFELSKNDERHEVAEVTGNFRRFSYLAQIKKNN